MRYHHPMHPLETHYQNATRRAFLKQSGLGFGAMALGSLLTESLFAATPGAAGNPLAARASHFAPRAKRVIYLHMVGGP